MIFTVEVKGFGKIQEEFEERMALAYHLDKMYDKKENGLTDLTVIITITATDGAEDSVYYKGTLYDFIIPSKFYLNVESNDTKEFDDRDKMDDYLRDLVKIHGYSIKTSISIIDEGKIGNYINQFLGEIWHYLDDWDGDILGNLASAPEPVLN